MSEWGLLAWMATLRLQVNDFFGSVPQKCGHVTRSGAFALFEPRWTDGRGRSVGHVYGQKEDEFSRGGRDFGASA